MNITIKNILTFVVALFSAIGSIKALIQDSLLCLVLIILSVVALTITFVFWKQNRERALLFIVCSAITIVSSTYGIIKNHIIKARADAWEEYIKPYLANSLDPVKDKADANDGIAQMTMAKRCFKSNHFGDAREYAQKAANNGNGEAYLMLGKLYFYGLGVPKDVHHAVSYLISCNKIIEVSDIDNLIFEIEDSGSIISTRDKESLRLCSQYWRMYYEISDEIRQCVESNSSVLALLRRYNQELVNMSANGFLRATLLLYMEGIEEYRESPNIDMTNELKERLQSVAKTLLDANYIPTDPQSRLTFFSLLNESLNYTASNVDIFINNNIYPELVLSVTLENDVEDDNEYRFARYKLYRAQYEYTKSIVTGERLINQMPVTHYPTDIHTDYEKAKKLLQESIDAIQTSMPSLKAYLKNPHFSSSSELLDAVVKR